MGISASLIKTCLGIIRQVVKHQSNTTEKSREYLYFLVILVLQNEACN